MPDRSALDPREDKKFHRGGGQQNTTHRKSSPSDGVGTHLQASAWPFPIQEPPRRGNRRAAGTREGECFTALSLAELQIPSAGHAWIFTWASRDVGEWLSMGYACACCPQVRARNQGDWHYTGSICPSPPTILSRVLEFEDFETSMHLAKTKRPQVNLYQLDPRPCIQLHIAKHQNTLAQDSTYFMLKAYWLKHTEEKTKNSGNRILLQLCITG